jgi:NAD(P)-dependent dehydrogenase (short-subunit alcohol dehydrogenase family)
VSHAAVGRVAIVGLSSGLGAGVANELTAAHPTLVVGTYRHRHERLQALAATYRQAGLPLELRALDVTDAAALASFAGHLGSDETPLTVVYCCGVFVAGGVAELAPAALDEAIAVGLRAPSLLVCELARRARAPWRIIIVSGLGGERAATAGNGGYALVTNGLYAFVRAAGAELAGSARSCTAVALGLFDKGQSYLDDVAGALNIGRPPPIADAAKIVARLVVEPQPLLNGGVVELSGGLQDYGAVVALKRAQMERRA